MGRQTNGPNYKSFDKEIVRKLSHLRQYLHYEMIVSGKIHFQMGPLYVFSEVRIQAYMTQGEKFELVFGLLLG